ncbi:MotA/TolQ/ExbB proton channel family protein [Calothrix sp. UHCC 0171]|uniref:MotA/TolQ/ExbB proton channel family protein n=1 Tax=Calothrix sp. UHCC 0171 TaxID=3110245 RepID=UPI002B2181D6|nr:MotA/TolQ/ExbB proton channel family protein [Calothrix sp. UHCC 0171]MEA5570661.1 MotA/TolQ/ExbB proton channel family protein [Calothrix sp. UHCC 0171]
MDILAEFRKGGIAMYPLAVLSVLVVSVILERLWFWLRLLNQEKQIVTRVLEAAREDWTVARDIAQRAIDQPIGRFLFAPLNLPKADAETFRLALESSADHELSGMRRGDKLLEAAIALAPLLGLFGTVTGLIQSLRGIKIGDLVEPESIARVTGGIGESLYSTATGMVVAIVSLAFYRLFQAFIFNQVRIFQRAGNDLELLYRQSPPNYDLLRLSAETQNPERYSAANYPTEITPATTPNPTTSETTTQDSFNYPRRRHQRNFGEPYEPSSDNNSPDSENS